MLANVVEVKVPTELVADVDDVVWNETEECFMPMAWYEYAAYQVADAIMENPHCVGLIFQLIPPTDFEYASGEVPAVANLANIYVPGGGFMLTAHHDLECGEVIDKTKLVEMDCYPHEHELVSDGEAA